MPDVRVNTAIPESVHTRLSKYAKWRKTTLWNLATFALKKLDQEIAEGIEPRVPKDQRRPAQRGPRIRLQKRAAKTAEPLDT